MLICENCGAIFEEPVKGFEEEKDSCPCCGDWGFKTAVKCKVCGEPSVNGLCDDCIEEFDRALDGFIRLYAKTLGLREDEVIELIEDHI